MSFLDKNGKVDQDKIEAWRKTKDELNQKVFDLFTSRMPTYIKSDFRKAQWIEIQSAEAEKVNKAFSEIDFDHAPIRCHALVGSDIKELQHAAYILALRTSDDVIFYGNGLKFSVTHENEPK